MKPLDSKPKVESNWRRHWTLTSCFHTQTCCIHERTYAHVQIYMHMRAHSRMSVTTSLERNQYHAFLECSKQRRRTRPDPEEKAVVSSLSLASVPAGHQMCATAALGYLHSNCPHLLETDLTLPRCPGWDWVITTNFTLHQWPWCVPSMDTHSIT